MGKPPRLASAHRRALVRLGSLPIAGQFYLARKKALPEPKKQRPRKSR